MKINAINQPGGVNLNLRREPDINRSHRNFRFCKQCGERTEHRWIDGEYKCVDENHNFIREEQTE